MMKYGKLSPLLLAAVLFLLNACGPAEAPEPTDRPEAYTPTYTEIVAADNGYSLGQPAASLDEVCRGAAVIVKAVYLGYREFSAVSREYLFDAVEEYTDLLDQRIIHVYESREASFVSGKTYYLFLTGFISCLYPHTVYSRVVPGVLIGEEETGHTFYGGRTLGLEGVADLGRHIREEIIAKGMYDRDAAYLVPESAADACAHAAVILVAAVSSVQETGSGNPYVRYAGYTVERFLKGEDLYRDDARREAVSGDVSSAAGTDGKNAPLMQAPADAAAGDRFILLFRIDPETDRLDMFSLQYACLRAESAEGREILDRFA